MSLIETRTDGAGVADIGGLATYNGCALVAARPHLMPELWMAYLRGAKAAYRRHDCEAAIDIDAIADGSDTELFVVATDLSGTVRGGLRVTKQLTAPGQSHALVEWAGHEDQPALAAEIERRLADGVVEAKSAWADVDCDVAQEVAARLSRVPPLVLLAGDVRYIMATAAEHVLARWRSGGGRVDESIAAAPYPDRRYRTRLMWWDLSELPSILDPQVEARLRVEFDEFATQLALSDVSYCLES